MFSFKPKKPASTQQYTPIEAYRDGESSSSSSSAHEKRSSSSSSSSEDHDSEPLLESSDNVKALTPQSSLPKLVIYLSLALALLSTLNAALLPATLKRYKAYTITSDTELEASLPYGDARLGLDRAAEKIPPPKVYHRSWPDKITPVSRKLKDSVYGNGVEVYITVEDSTIMRFPVPQKGSKTACAINWRPPPEFSARLKDLTTKGDISEIEVWQLIAPSLKSPKSVKTLDDINYDTLSYSTLPVRGELLGVLDLTAGKGKENSTTVDFACPTGEGSKNLVVELRCQRVGCHVGFKQIESLVPRFGFEIVRRVE